MSDLQDINKADWYLEGVLNDGRNWKVPLTTVPFKIGRQKDCDLPLLPKNISRYHAEFVSSGPDLILRDLKSSNGTYVNHKRISKDTKINTGDTIHFGTLEFQIFNRDILDPYLSERTVAFQGDEDIPKGYEGFIDEFLEMFQKKAVTPFFQPIKKLASKNTIGYEVLGRSFYKDLPNAPIELFNIASCVGYEARLSQLFRYVGVQKGKNIPGAPNLFLNAHPVEMYQVSLLESLQEIRRLAPALPITLEINEKSVYDIALIKQLRLALNDLNIGLAYDDFGSGQARFVELIEVPPDYLKFDLALIKNIHKAPVKFKHMVKSLVKMAQDLEIDTVAEGIECEEEYEVCMEIGFNYAQGFWLGKPAPIK